MKINLIGAYGVEGMHTHLAEMLNKYGVEAEVNSASLNFDAVIVMGLWNLSPKLWSSRPEIRIPIIAYGCGSDVWQGWSNLKKTRFPLLEACDVVLYGHPDMQYVTNVKGAFWHVPIDTDLFSIQPSMRYNASPRRDVLLYAPNPGTYCLDKIMDYVNSHPKQKCSLLGGAYESLMSADLPENLIVQVHAHYHGMPRVYLNHKEFRLWLSTPATPMSNMEAEALRMGLKVYRNDMEVTKIPGYMFMEEAIPRLKNFLNT
jgi:hypothetical protein